MGGFKAALEDQRGREVDIVCGRAVHLNGIHGAGRQRRPAGGLAALRNSTVPVSVTGSGLPSSYAPPGGDDRQEELDHEGRFTG